MTSVSRGLCSVPDQQAAIRKTIADLKECVSEMKKEYESNDRCPLTDNCQSLQRFCVKMEHLLQIGMKDRSGIMTGKKDYWDYFRDCLSGNKYLKDGLHFVRSLAELKSSLGRGRAFIRFGLVHHRLADTIQQCVICQRQNRDWYCEESFLYQRGPRDDLILALYDLNDISFDLSSRGYDLDNSWPSFARKSAVSGWKPPSRSGSITSLSSIPNLEVYPSLPANSLPSYSEECFPVQDASFLSQQSDGAPDFHWSDNNDKYDSDRIAELEKIVDELQHQLQQEQQNNYLASENCRKAEDNLQKAEEAFRSKESSWLAERNEMVDQITELKQCYQQVQNEASSQNSQVTGDVERLDHVADKADGADSVPETTTADEHLQNSDQASCEANSKSEDGDIVAQQAQLSGGGTEDSTSNYLFEIEQLKLLLQQEQEKATDDVNRFVERVATLEREQKLIADERQSLQIANSSLSEELSNTKQELGSLKVTLQEARFFETAYREVLQDKSSLEEQIVQLRDLLQTSRDEIDQLNATNKAEEDRLVDLACQMTTLQSESNSLVEELALVRTELADCYQTIEQMKSDAKLAEEISGKAERDYQTEICSLITRINGLEQQLIEKHTLSCELDAQNKSFNQEISRIFSEYEQKQIECSRLTDRISALELEVTECKKITEELQFQNEESTESARKCQNELSEAEVKWRSVVDERDQTIAGLRDDLEALTGSLQRRERMWESARERMEQEIQTHQCELNQKTTDYETKIKSLSDLLSSARAEYEITQVQRQEELDDLKQCLGSAEQEIFTLKQQLQQVSEDRNGLQLKMDLYVKQMTEECGMLKVENKQFRSHIVKLLRDKANLWQKSDKLAHERQMRKSNSWLESSGITNCMQCCVEFTVTVRKHHCRECGKVFCWSCCNNWIQTAHSERKERVCVNCVKELTHATTTSSNESDNDDETASNDADNVTVTSQDQFDDSRNNSVLFGESDVTVDETSPINSSSSLADGVTESRPAGHDVMSQSLPADSSAWSSLRSGTNTAVTWVTGMWSWNRRTPSAAVGTLDGHAAVENQPEPSPSSVLRQSEQNASSLQSLMSKSVSELPSTGEDVVDPRKRLHSYPEATTQVSRIVADNNSCVLQASAAAAAGDCSNQSPAAAAAAAAAAVDIARSGSVQGAQKILTTESVTKSTSDDSFDVITPDEVSESLKYPLPDPNVECAQFLRTADLKHSEESVEQSDEVSIKAGKAFAVPVSIDIPNFILNWHFTTQPKGITFSVTYKESELIPYLQCDKLIDDWSVNSHQQPCEGQLEARRAGVYTLVFDNTLSRFTAKKLKYTVRLVQPSR